MLPNPEEHRDWPRWSRTDPDDLDFGGRDLGVIAERHGLSRSVLGEQICPAGRASPLTGGARARSNRIFMTLTLGMGRRAYGTAGGMHYMGLSCAFRRSHPEQVFGTDEA